ncbi:phage virion morphogenesis protein [Thauera sp.]|uniref:phage virion morphogenesis protein n=1 Tax=Thauera sp. TaxID=1905334 RepID=UPI002D16052A|nr:phage virion morphogenesis protein [Thauera sp.]HRP26519.1 phage virion morphogenesis protein [Thauera sp.]
MADRISIELDIRDVVARLSRLSDAVGPGGLEPAFRQIGEDLIESVKRRFETGTAPDGSRWEPNSMVTIMKFLGDSPGNFRKDGRINKRGASAAASKRPLVRHGNLQTTIDYFVGDDELLVGSPLEFAAMQQFGGRKSAFPHLWGDIPARPFLGVDDDDVQRILDVIELHLSRAAL